MAASIRVSVALLAHHAFSAEFDANAPVKLRGPVTKVEWINPHAWIHIEVEDDRTGKAETWMVEGGTPNTLQRGGISRDSIKIGTVIMCRGYQAKDGRLRANGRDITFPDGRTLFMGSSGTGAPRDGAIRMNGESPSRRGSDMTAGRFGSPALTAAMLVGLLLSACVGRRNSRPIARRARSHRHAGPQRASGRR